MINEKHSLRQAFKAHLFDGSAGIMGITWQGDFGRGVETGSGTFSEMGANPCTLYVLPAAGSSIPQPQFKPGQRVFGNAATEWLYCRLVLAATTDLLPGDVYQIDENWLLTKLTTAAALLNYEVGIGQVFAPATVAGTYYIWVATKGHCIVRAAASSIISGMGETTTTAGQLKFLTSHTGGSLTVSPLAALQASSNITFTGNTVNGSPTISAVASQISVNGSTGGITDLTLGATITGTNLPSNACIAAIRQTGTTWAIDIGTSTTGAQNTLQNASGTATGTTFTLTTVVQAAVNDPYVSAQN
jgi:hypothetical protein